MDKTNGFLTFLDFWDSRGVAKWGPILPPPAPPPGAEIHKTAKSAKMAKT